jgi:hypothetical protein
MADLAPLVLRQTQPGEFSLTLTDDHMVDVMDVFAKHGYHGNGYGWEGVAQTAVAAHAPELEERLEFGPEAGMFVAYGSDQATMERLGVLLHKAFHNREFLNELLANSEPDWFD